jgi:hypothetical protein
MSAKCHEQTSRPISIKAYSFEEAAIDDAANRPLKCEVGTDQPVWGLGLAPLRGALSALHTAGLPTRLFGVALGCPVPNAQERTPPV